MFDNQEFRPQSDGPDTNPIETSPRSPNKNRPRGHVLFTQARGRYFLWLVQSGMASWVRRM